MTTTRNMQPSGLPLADTNGAFRNYIDVKERTGLNGTAKQFNNMADREDKKQYLKAQFDLNTKELSMKQEELERKQKNEVLKQARQDKEYGAKVKTFRDYLKANKINDSKYSDDDIYYHGDTIVKAHDDPTDFKFTRTYQMGDNKIVAEYKNPKGELQHKVIFDGGVKTGAKDLGYGFNADGTAKTAQQFGEEQAKNRAKKRKASFDLENTEIK